MKNIKLFLIAVYAILLGGCHGKSEAGEADTIQERTLSEVFIPGNTVKTRFEVPEGYKRVEYPDSTFAGWLQNLPLKPIGYETHLYNGELKENKVASAVIDMDVDPVDLQQCADAIIRLRAEYLFSKGSYSDIHFNFTNGFRCDFDKWAQGYRIKINGNHTEWYKKYDTPDYSYKNLREYLLKVFEYAGTASLAKELNWPDFRNNIWEVGSILITPASNGQFGHAVIVVDKIVNEKDSTDIAVLFAQSYMPAQEIEILKPAKYNFLGDYTKINFKEGVGSTLSITTPEWNFILEKAKDYLRQNSFIKQF